MKTPNEIAYDLVLLSLHDFIKELCEKNNFDSHMFFELVCDISQLKNYLDDYIDMDRENPDKRKFHKEIIAKGKVFNHVGGIELMRKVCSLMQCCNASYAGILNRAWDDIGGWAA